MNEWTEGIASKLIVTSHALLLLFRWRSHIEDALHYAVLHGYRRMNKDDERHLVSTINEAKAANKMRGRVLFFFTTPLAQVRAAA